MSITGLNLGRIRVSGTIFSKLITSTLLFGVLTSSSVAVNAQTSSQAIRMRQTEGRNNTWEITRAQQAYYYSTKDGKFARTIQELGVNIQPETEHYRYRILSFANQTQKVIITGQAKLPGLKSYTGVVYLAKLGGEWRTISMICETAQASTTPPAMPSPPTACPAGSSQLGRRK